MTFDRRGFIGGTIASGIALGASGCIPPDPSPAGRLVSTLRIIEAQTGGTLGAELFEVRTGRSIGLNRTKRFGHCSSFKTSLAAMVLARDVSGEDDADRMVSWSQSDLMGYSQFTTDRLTNGATLRELAEATQTFSDNTAANVLLRETGGPEALTAFWRSIGDDVSRLDRIEPSLNNVPLTETRDTTTASTMARTLANILYGDVLPKAQRTILRQWMTNTATGLRRVRAGLPDDWVTGDKTGTSFLPGMDHLYVDIGFAESPDRGPFTFAAYFHAPAQTIEQAARVDQASEAVLAQVGEVLTKFAEKQDAFPF